MLARAMHQPSRPLLAAAERVLIYLNHHKYLGLTYVAETRDPFAFSDSDWATRCC